MFLSRSTDKVSLPKWIDENTYQKYLAGECVDTTKGEELYAADRNIGIAIDSQSGTAIDKKLYQAEYLRLNTGVSMCYEAECVIKPKHRDGLVDVLEREDFPKKLIIGGQGGICNMKESSFDLRSKMLSQNESTPSKFVRWTLLTPMVNVSGWLPGFVNSQTGQVMLKKENVERQPNESRQAWKDRQNKAPSFSERCKLVAACIGKAIGFSGWDLQKNEPKGTCLAVPAGSVYIFECESEDEARALINALSYPNRRSDLYGEKGFGIGVCSFYNKF
jgi:CRISPR type III-B/RAMP module-associated protein Cmr3